MIECGDFLMAQNKLKMLLLYLLKEIECDNIKSTDEVISIMSDEMKKIY